MTALMLVVVVLAAVVCFLLGWLTCGRWQYPSHRAATVLSVIFAVAGLVAIGDVFYLHQQFQDQVACNTALIHTLSERSDARNQVDASTRAAQDALVPVLTDLADGHPTNTLSSQRARDAFAAAAGDRALLATVLAEPYPQC